ncbi:MAG: endonuclease/exonuclease/phosphatase family protein [Lutibacter sp.]|nr:endonuclease/exonuclease/phosphatase family protein [Lutibacter sp.]MBP9601267.1 endonuclease/exonuclease/phosphatase family protein [Lutibacter sp.]
MKFSSFLLLIIAICLSSCKSQKLQIMTYNIRLDVASDGENTWTNRKDFLSSQVLFYSPDILGVQEAKPNQMNNLQETLKDYKVIGLGRDGNQQGEHSSIFYNSKKLKVDKEATFWLSETPNKVSIGWDAAYPRICTYGLFTLLESKQKVWVFNTHLDHLGTKAQLEGMKLILKKIAEVNTNNFPSIIMGDFNVEPDSELMATLKQQMNDSKEFAKITFGSNGTFNGFKFHEPATVRIDYIMVSKSDKINVEKHGVLSSSIDLKYPSDHFPVFVELKLK